MNMSISRKAIFGVAHRSDCGTRGRAAEPGPAGILSAYSLPLRGGKGSVKAVADAIGRRRHPAPSAEEYLILNSRAMNAVFAESEMQGISRQIHADIRIRVSLQYDSGNNTAPKITGYQVTNTVFVTVDDPVEVGAAIDALVNSGANSLGGISLTIRAIRNRC